MKLPPPFEHVSATLDEFVGLDARELEAHPPSGFAEVRVVMEDGWFACAGSSTNPTRLNLIVRNGVVDAAWRG